MVHTPAPSMRRLAGRTLAFVGIGLVLYAMLLAAAEQLVLATGHANPFFRIATLQAPSVDLVVLGSSHAMPLDFGDSRQLFQAQAGDRVLNLATTGAGPLYQRFVFERFLREHRARQVLLVVDSFTFYSATWNEERFADAKLLARTPFDPALASAFWRLVLEDGVPPRAWLDYASGFSKVNNRDRFKPDSWEGESQFDRVWRPSASAVKKRIAYLYPDGTPAQARRRYLGELSRIVALASESGTRVVAIKLPTPAPYRDALPGEAQFDLELTRMLAAADVPYRDFSGALPQPRFYFDSDHLNRAGVRELVPLLAPLLGAAPPAAARL